jgi:hypothetical protein
MRVRVQHVLQRLSAQRRFGAAQPRRHDSRRLPPEIVQLLDGERMSVVDLGEGKGWP